MTKAKTTKTTKTTKAAKTATSSRAKKAAPPAKKKAGASTASGTRTSSRSAKRRSPKNNGPDAELIEFERLQFLKAIDAYKRRTEQTFPSWSEVLDVIRSIGWLSPARLSEQQSNAK